MFIPASSEFVTLCQSQVSILTQGLGAALSAVYLTEELVEGAETKLVPIVVYPDVPEAYKENTLALPEQIEQAESMASLPSTPLLLPEAFGRNQNFPQGSTTASWQESSLQQQRQIILPLIHEDVVVGLLVTSRKDRPWTSNEKGQIEGIARTLTVACLMDRRRAWLEEKVSQQQRLQAQQRDRLDDLLHQFRNPLTAVRTFGKLLLKRLLPGDKNSEVANSIVRESERLQELLQQFDQCLDMTEAELEPLTLTAAPIPEEVSVPASYSLLPGNIFSLESFFVIEVLSPMLISAQAIAQERNLELHAQIPSNLPPVYANPRALREVLSNLIDNALKYTPAGGRVYIEVDVQQHSPQEMYQAIAISDTGSGIPPQDLEHLFERHYRGVQAAGDIPGSGLGLAIAQELVEQMHGEIEVFSPANASWMDEEMQEFPSSGTTFIVWLPLVSAES
ncbi:MAG: HAMP domain-containing histidine kinase [Kastovskya adunca ATA6-11-RM4]|jgi:signal transduction histidine kinase|nr:HAMP domain-containing histidine kinase [Kastovskya adunca ATA6-11-RM4]